MLDVSASIFSFWLSSFRLGSLDEFDEFKSAESAFEWPSTSDRSETDGVRDEAVRSDLEPCLDLLTISESLELRNDVLLVVFRAFIVISSAFFSSRRLR